jgi:hypothetical protein
MAARGKEAIVSFDRAAIDQVLQSFQDLGLVNETERNEILFVIEPDFPFASEVKLTESIHAHVKVPDTDELPHDKLIALGFRPENGRPGYIKYSTDAAFNLILSSIPIAADDQIVGAVTLPKPFMDHVGIDMRDESASTRAEFDTVPDRAAELGWREATQVGPVHCCHTEVESKHWVYPPEDWAGWRRPIEFAFGTLKIFTEQMGCDLRPIDPGHPLAPAASSACCGAPAAQIQDVAAPTCG